jgi:hypothetical protein
MEDSGEPVIISKVGGANTGRDPELNLDWIRHLALCAKEAVNGGRWVAGYWPLPEPTHYVGVLPDDIFSSKLNGQATGPVHEDVAQFIAAVDPDTILAMIELLVEQEDKEG